MTDVIMLSPGYPAEMPYFTRALATVGARVIGVVTEGSASSARIHADWVLEVPRTSPELAPALAIMPLQILAYRIARLRGLPVDQPRNLAKTVTVE